MPSQCSYRMEQLLANVQYALHAVNGGHDTLIVPDSHDNITLTNGATPVVIAKISSESNRPIWSVL